ncbi:MAG TPA: hypothetical protein VMU05_17485 [Dongiaceae bacterium]|nr:hypothetical protein [Dongiaceae bacterium]
MGRVTAICCRLSVTSIRLVFDHMRALASKERQFTCNLGPQSFKSKVVTPTPTWQLICSLFKP